MVQKREAVQDCFLLFLFTALIYLPFLGLPAWDGNEPLRVILAKDMLKNGNWIIPSLHGQPYFTKPPMMNWFIAGTASLFTVVNEWTSRLPSVAAVYLTALTLYFMTKQWLGREGRIFAALAVLTMVGLIEKGRTAEIDSLFVFLVVILLLTWFRGYTGRWNPLVLWSVSLTLLGIGFLAKGPQIIGYFYLSICGYLLYRRNVRFLFTLQHAAGMICFIGLMSLYLAVVFQDVSYDKYFQMWYDQIIDRAESKHSFSFFAHFFYYPVEAVLNFMPWTLLLLPVIIWKELRESAKKLLTNELLIFSLAVVVINFPLYWLLPNARFRYFLPAGPFVALGIAVLYELYLSRAGENTVIQRFLNGLLIFCAGVALVSSIGAITAVFFLKAKEALFPTPLLILICSLILLGVYIWYAQKAVPSRQVPLWLALTAGLLFITYSCIDIQVDSIKRNNPRLIAERIDGVLPADNNSVYVIGYRRFLSVACYMNRDFIQLDEFSDLQSLSNRKDNVYFLFDTKYPETRDYRKKDFQEIRWDKVYSEFFEESRGDIVIGLLKRT